MFLVGGIPVYRSIPGKDVADKTLKLLMKLMSDQVQKNKRPIKEFLRIISAVYGVFWGICFNSC